MRLTQRSITGPLFFHRWMWHWDPSSHLRMRELLLQIANIEGLEEWCMWYGAELMLMCPVRGPRTWGTTLYHHERKHSNPFPCYWTKEIVANRNKSFELTLKAMFDVQQCCGLCLYIAQAWRIPQTSNKSSALCPHWVMESDSSYLGRWRVFCCISNFDEGFGGE